VSLDETILRALNGLAADPGWATFAHVLSSPMMLVMVGMPLIAIYRRERLHVFISVVIAVSVADMVSSRMIKPIVGRERPCRAVAGLEKPQPCGGGKSFPSSHAATAFALFTAAAPTVTKSAYWLGPLALGVALSRVVLGVHYPSDIIAGAILGTFIGWLTRRGLAQYEARFRSPKKPPALDPPSPTAPDPPAP